jgi:hypothetical protein
VTALSSEQSTATQTTSRAALPPGDDAVTNVSPLRTVLRRAGDVIAVVLVWLALGLPDRLYLVTTGHLLRFPVELLLLVVVGVVLRGRTRAVVAALIGLLVGLLVVAKVLDMGFFSTLDRPFNPVDDWVALRPALGVVKDSVGGARTIVIVSVVVVVAVAILVVLVWSSMRVAAAAGRYRSGSIRAAVVVAAASTISAVTGVAVGGSPSVATTATANVFAQQVGQAGAAIHDRHVFVSLLHGRDAAAAAPAGDLLSGLRGKDVLVVFVESYGRVAVEGSSFAPQVDRALTLDTSQLEAAGFGARSAFLTSPTFGGGSWLAHSTLQSGLWVANQQRYDQLVSSDRFTLNQAFSRAGWRTVVDVPSDQGPWAQATSFYHYDAVYGARDVGYHGPKFSYASMPDQYVLAAFQQMELDRRDRTPVMAEIDLVSSHTPWTPLPHMVDWNALGDGSVFDGVPAQGVSPQTLWRHSSFVQQSYGQSIQYSLTALTSFVQRLHDPNLVVVALGDHQPATIVSGRNASHDVPITIISHDQKVLDRIAPWGWQPGLLPDSHAPVWRMDSFRDRFLAAFR